MIQSVTAKIFVEIGSVKVIGRSSQSADMCSSLHEAALLKQNLSDSMGYRVCIARGLSQCIHRSTIPSHHTELKTHLSSHLS
jgi:hypothetical protein